VAKTSNELLLDALIRHQIYLMRFSGAVRKKIEKLLNATEKDLAQKIRDMLRDPEPGSALAIRRLEQLEEWIKNLRYKTFDEIDETWVRSMKALAQQEPTFVAAAMNTTAPVLLDLVLPAPAMLRAIVETHPVEGKVLKTWAKDLRKVDVDRIISQIKIGMVQGEPSDVIARRVVGTAKLSGADGVTEMTRRDAAAITRTTVNAIANEAKQMMYEENSDILDQELFVATLDSNTTAVCRANDGKTFPLGKGPIPPLHFQCRSLRVAIFDGVILGNRPAKPFTQKQLVKEFAKQEDLGDISSRDDLPRGYKSDYDEYERQRIRELTGRVPATTSYQTWLEGQSASFQDDILGKTKGTLFRDGDLQLDKFINRNGDELTLAELAEKHAEAFRAAGLDPEDFL